MKTYVILFLVLLLASCDGQEPRTASLNNTHEDHQHEQQGQALQQEEVSKDEAPEVEGEEEHNHSEVQVSQEKQKEWGIEVGSATVQNISSRLTLPGIMTLNQNQTAHISSFVAGKVAEVPVDLGASVKKGQNILTINSPEFAQAQANFLEARARLNLSQKEYERAITLREEQAIEEKEFLRRKAEYEKLVTEFGALGSALHSYGLTHVHIDALIAKCDAIMDDEYKCEIADPNLSILSPIKGTVVYRDVILGEHINPEKILFTVSDLSILWAQLDAYEKDLPFISENSRVIILSSLFPDRQFEGKITYISDLIDEKSRTVKIRVEVANPDGWLKPNMYIQGTIEKVSPERDVLVIPEDAIQNLDGEKIVFVPESPEVFAARRILLGQSVGNWRIILGGLEKDEKIVLKGAFYLKAELTKSTFGHAHIH